MEIAAISTKPDALPKIRSILSQCKVALINSPLSKDERMISCSIYNSDEPISDDELLNNCIPSVELSVSLMMLKVRYHLSHECINDILRILREFSVDVPSSYKSMKNLFCKQVGANKPVPVVKYICPSCTLPSTSAAACSSCSATLPIDVSPACFFNFDLTSQIEQILRVSPDLRLASDIRRNVAGLRDIVDGVFYQRLLLAEQGNNFITLTMNVDGVSPNRGSTLSIWPIFLVINEIDESKRFALENLIVAGIWPGPSKPSREQIFTFFADIVQELKVLEEGRVFQMYSSCGSGSARTRSLKVSDSYADRLSITPYR